MLTLVHEDIYIYADPIIEYTETKKDVATTCSFTNDAIEQVADLGVFEVNISSGSFTQLVITIGDKAATFNGSFGAGNILTLNFRDLYFANGDALIFPDDIPVLTDGEIEEITVSLTGSGFVEVTRNYNKIHEQGNDIWFVESLSVDTSIERPKKTLVSGKEKTINSEKKVHSFSINGLWSQEEVSKFTDLFRLWLVDEEGNKLNVLANCRIDSNGYSSSSNGDLTYAISGSCEKIF